MELNVVVSHSLLFTSIDTINYTIEHILQYINSDGACAWRGGLPEQPRVGGCRRTGWAAARAAVQNNVILS